MSEPKQHINNSPATPAAERRIYIHPALLVIAIIATLAALVIVVVSFNMRWNATSALTQENAALRVELEKCRTAVHVLEVEKTVLSGLTTSLAAQEAEAEIISKLAREGATVERRNTIDGVRAITRRYLFTASREGKDAETVVRELCGEYAKTGKGVACY